MALNDVVYNKTVDVAQSMPVPVVFAKQNENGKRKVIVTLLKDGQPFVIGTGISGYIQGATAQNPVTKQPIRFKRALTSLDTTANTATFVIAQSMTAEIGITQCEIALYDTTKPDEIICTANINIEVQGTGMSLQDEMASDDYQAIVSIKTEVTAMRDEVRTKTNQAIAAQGAAETAAQNAYNSALGVQKIVAGNEAYTKQEADLKYSVAPRKVQSTTTGEMQLTDTDDGLAYLSLEGNSEQYTNTANKNLIDLHFCTYGYIDNATPGTPAPNAMMSGFIRCDISKSYILNMNNTITMITFVFYDKDKNRLGDIKEARIIATPEDYPSGTYWMRVNMSTLIKDQMQLEEGTVSTAYVQGAVDTPSPDYPSEVKSVGDIPKDVNGVEIRNILDEDTLKNPDNWSVQDKNLYYVKLSPSVAKLFGAGYKISTISFSWQSVLYLSEALTAGSNVRITLINNAGGVQSGSYTFPSADPIYLIAYNRNDDEITKAQFIDELFKCYKLMITEAAEIDEYRPYIGENNGLVKLESIGKNLFDINIFSGANGTVQINGNEVTWENWNGILGVDIIKKGFKENAQYCISFDKKSIGIINTRLEVIYTDDTRDVLGTETNTEYKHYTDVSRAGKTIKSIVPSYGKTEDRYKMFFRNIQIEEGTKETPYQPYRQQITWIPLREPLRKIGDYADTIDKNGNVTQMLYQTLYENIVYFNYFQDQSNGKTYLMQIGTYDMQETNVPKKIKIGYSNMLKNNGNIWTSDTESFGIGGVNYDLLDIRVLKSRFLSTPTKETLQEILKGYIVCYVLNTPINYKIPEVYIETYQQETNVRCLNEIKPSSMNMDYKIAINSLIKRLEALETTTVQEVTK